MSAAQPLTKFRVTRTHDGATVSTYGPFAHRGLAEHVAKLAAEKHTADVVSVEPIQVEASQDATPVGDPFARIARSETERAERAAKGWGR